MLCVFMCACGSPAPEDSSTPPPGLPSTAGGVTVPSGALVIADVSIVGPDGVLFELRADGSVVAQGQRVGTLGGDGRLVTPEGEVVAQLADGHLSVAGRPVARIEGRVATLDEDGARLEFGADGQLRSAEGVDDDMPVRLEPADSPAATAALVLVLVFMF